MTDHVAIGTILLCPPLRGCYEMWIVSLALRLPHGPILSNGKLADTFSTSQGGFP
jgi:hypothetical protein